LSSINPASTSTPQPSLCHLVRFPTWLRLMHLKEAVDGAAVGNPSADRPMHCLMHTRNPLGLLPSCANLRSTLIVADYQHQWLLSEVIHPTM
jgi:hypothetical protein